MKCPRTFFATDDGEGGLKLAGAACIRKECAWWEEDLNLCAVKELALELRYTQLRLADLLDKMPHEKG